MADQSSRRDQWVRVLSAIAVMAAVASGGTALLATTPALAAGPSPIPVTPFSGFNSLLTRAPYVTDLSQTGADVSWATTSSALGTLDWGPLGNCAANQTPVPPSLPNSYPAAGTPPSITQPAFSVVSGTTEYQSTVVLTGLSPSTTYCYRPLGAGGVDLLGSNASQQFTTLDPAGSSVPLTFDVVGDLGETLYSSSTSFPNNLNTDQAAIDSLIGSSGAKFVLTAGDVGYAGGTEADYGDLINGGSEVSDIFGPSYWPQTGGLPVFPGEGNHGQNAIGLRTWPASNTAAASGGTYAYDSYPANSQDGTNAGTYPDAWYAFSDANVRIYVLDVAWADSNVGTATGSACTNAGESACPGYQVDHDMHWTPTSPEYQWLAADLASHPGVIKVAVWHYPLRSDQSSQDSDVYLQNSSVNPYQSSSLESLLAANGVTVVFNGHAHGYSRITPNSPGSLTTYVTGGGGAILEPVQTGSACTSLQGSGAVYAIGWSPTSNSGTACGATTPQSAAQVYNFIKVTVNGDTMTVTPINAAGQSFDVQTYTLSVTPAVVIDTPPPSLTNSTSASIAFHASSGSPSFTCSLDGASPMTCSSPLTLTGLAQGSHQVTVAASGYTPATTSWTVDTTPPSTPAITTGTAVSATQVDLAWSTSTDNVGVTGYDVYRNGLLLTPTPVTATSYTDMTASPGATFQYTVDARDGAGNVSPQSSPFPVTTPAGSAGPALVQSAVSSTTSVTLPVPSTPGDLLVLSASVYTGATRPITAVTDSAGDTWTEAGNYFISGANSDGELWYTAGSGSVTSVTVTTGATAVALQLDEFSGVATSNALDSSVGTSGHSTSASSGSATASGSGDLAVGFIAGHGTSQAITVTSPGYSALPMQTTTSPNTVTVLSGYSDLAASGATSFTGSFGAAMNWAAGVALFKPGSPPPPPGDFTIADAPGSATVTAGSAATSSISTTAVGTPEQVAFSATGLPAGATVSFAPPSVTAGDPASLMTISTSPTTPAGTFPITVTGTSVSAQHSVGFSLVVQAPPAITSAASTTFTTNVADSFTVTTTGSPTPSLSVSGVLPAGVSFIDNHDGTATIAGTATSASSSTLTITAANAVGSVQQTFTLNVVPPVTNDFSLSASPGSATITQGATANTTVTTAVTSGSAQTVGLSASGAPAGATVSFNPQSLAAGQSSAMTVTTSSSTPTGTFPVTLTGTGASATHSTTFSLTVTPAPAGPALVQVGSGTEAAAAASLSGSFPATSGAGDLLVLAASVYTGSTDQITSVTDSAGNIWTKVGAYDASGHYSDGELWYAANAQPTTTVTVHVKSATTVSFELLDFTGVATSPLDSSAGASNTGTSAASGTASSGASNELAVGFVAGHTSAQAIMPSAAGYTTEPEQTSTGTGTTSVVAAFEVLPAPGATAFTATFSSSMYWAAGVALFKP